MMLSSISRGAIRLLSRGGESGRLSVFIFHRVVPTPDPLCPDEPCADQFEWMVRAIAKSFNVLPLVVAADLLRRGQLPPRAAAVTFDDGYEDNYTIAWPILSRYRVPATFFIATSFLDGGRMWNDEVIDAVRKMPAGELDWSAHGLGRHELGDAKSRIACYSRVLSKLKYYNHARRTDIARQMVESTGTSGPLGLMMSTEQVRRLRAQGADIGAHTHTHPILERIDDSSAEHDIRIGRECLEGILGEPVNVFAYPNGRPGVDYSSRHVALLHKLGFKVAVSTEMGVARPGADLLQLPRFTPWDRTEPRFLLRAAMALWPPW